MSSTEQEEEEVEDSTLGTVPKDMADHSQNGFIGELDCDWDGFTSW